MISLKRILKKIKKDNFEVYGNRENAISYNMVSTIIKSFPLQDNTLYVCYASQLQENHLKYNNVGFLVIPDIDFSTNIFIAGELAVWDEYVDLEIPLTKVQIEFRKIIDIASNISPIISALIKGNSLNEIIEIAAKIIGNPLIVTNAAYKVVAMSDVQIDDPFWKFAKTYGYFSQEFINKIKNEGIAKKTVESDGPIFLNEGIARNIPRIRRKIAANNRIVGYITIYKIYKDFDQNTFDVINILSDIISIEMKINTYEDTFNNQVYENIIIDLLNNEISSPNILQARLEDANWNIKKYFCLLKLPLSETNDSIWFFDYFYTKLLKNTTLCKITKYNSALIILINYDTDSEYQQELNNILEVLQKNKIKCGVSRNFTELENLKLYYRQASKAYDIGEIINDASIYMYYYEDLALFHFFSTIQNKKSLQIFCHPGYQKLVEHDNSNSTEYCRSLYQYLLSASSVSDAAEKLFIHRNTMSYRLSKISEITGMDLSKGKDLFKLYMSIKIDEWLKL